jgi:hypothetical protein
MINTGTEIKNRPRKVQIFSGVEVRTVSEKRLNRP